MIPDPEPPTDPARADAVANAGLIRPPWVYLAALGGGLLVDALWPVRWLPAAVSVPIGVIVVLVAVVLFICAGRALRRAGTPVPGNRPTTKIVRAGPYRFSRNPIYLAFSLFHIGVAAWINSLALLLALVPALALMVRVVTREERYLEARFASEYRSYRRAVRRWL